MNWGPSIAQTSQEVESGDTQSLSELSNPKQNPVVSLSLEGENSASVSSFSCIATSVN